ncbi:hypothetical protein TR51_15325 [Kitasatospora griseola]|uniref:Uncharacterized protein n=1 Tax=Kitasatospora griseola TaxID=2064 RepID=A0A0D0NAP4_KITGR|nr:hypothetical protein [Kitasatospora griseola]KIQ65310.1 hypothetical protein TR51_15325 [Kitasatospora griseola]
MSTAATVTVFAGPSLRPADLTHLRLLAEERNRVLDLCPPVRRHDLASLIGAEAPRRTLMLDGEFDQSLAVSVTEVRALLFAARGEHLGAFHLHVVVQATVGPAVVSSR